MVFLLTSCPSPNDEERGTTPTVPTPVAPTRPERPIQGIVTTNSIELTWTEVIGATYDIYLGTVGLENNNNTSVITEASYRLIDLTANTQYIISLKAKNEVEESDFSPSLTVTTPSSTESPVDKIQAIEEKYPYFNIIIKSLELDSDTTPSTDATLENSKIFSLNEKKAILGYLDMIKFGINSEEFVAEVKKSTYHKTIDRFGIPMVPAEMLQEYNLAYGVAYDNDRLIKVIREFEYDLYITKGYTESAAASASVCTTLYKNLSSWPTEKGVAAYAVNLENYRGGWGDVCLSNRFQFDIDNFQAKTLIFHEILHNYGFSHGDANLDIKDLVRVLEDVNF